MDQQPNVSLEDSTKPSKLMALIALIIAFSLPFILVKSFPHKHRTNFSVSNTEVFEPVQTSIVTPIPSKSEVLNKRKPVSSIASNSITKKDKVEGVKPPQKVALQQKQTIKPSPSSPKPQEQVRKETPPNPNGDWKIIKMRKGDSLTTVFKRQGLSPQTLQNILRGNPHGRVFSHFKPDQEIQLLIKKKVLEKMVVPYSPTQDLMVYREGQRYISKINGRKTTTQNKIVTAVIRGSLYSTAKRNNVHPKLIKQMTEVFTWDINFAKDIRAGDQFTIIYQGYYIGDKMVDIGDILAVSYKTRGKTYQAVRHTDRTGHTDYYSPQGTSLKKAFDRYPLRFSHISSTFSLSRYHPILHYKRAHKGVDLAAPIGTPIRATGDGRIEIIGRQSGYGNMIKISHNKTYSTIYGHMLKFQKGLSRGDYVKRGQIIGYVGQTGLASGPHCHYEFHYNHQPKNPTTVDLPRGFPIQGREMASFKANSATLLAQLNAFEQGRLARR
ncbi:M23 family metallopeptidase [Legionella jordanis]|uniref:M23/M37 family transporter peptidase n=1 Tax=Legionella jordanis TaxID=456 RepID=A0A0W0V9S3_9GAMM|nr:peptidoglycan DD-metalloendopeptidase family protein [Legionella jordanis]KTD16850.1 M23/M37 family transporter peptidase [Legionella jordanis]RMX00363.1 peptidase M24 [Legionella jordanis]RMX15543.1 peptidase M24 [Legionella jordanis]VEH13547.1 peptidase, M23/M37 family [Legionella jordanis]